LIKRLKEEGQRVAEIDFPQYGQKSAALVEEYLNGEFARRKKLALTAHLFSLPAIGMRRVIG